ncbi:hypothetical protein [Erythrobacter dokdonensis]|uniref:Uncharacterized protein n=1 Tax=Erythrobacter dokdonensis DSW-74 TaxID=1300349 RepID=A0A1A7BH28_9SPHN|nr:hypothetical protein [Erythrobacter dokdonensis]OBV11021.1 hypothetical protein I603_1429 [Erythrobacter dokdonensis DSW-74]
MVDLVFVPALVAVLLNKEREKGSPLTEAEVIEIRDTSEVIAATREQHLEVIKERGYLDIDPENVWEAWQEARRDFEDLH